MSNALQAKQRTGFINGTISKPSIDDPNFENWQTVNSMIVGWIRTSIKPKVKSNITFISNARALWLDLKERFSVGNKMRVHQIKARIAACQQAGQPIIDYYGKPLTVCKCGLCTCGATLEPAKEREEEKIHQFILGLDDSRFGGLSTNLVAMDPFPSLGEIYSRVIREEQLLASAWVHEQHKEVVGFTTQTERSVLPSSRTEIQSGGRLNSSSIRFRSSICSHCGRSRHEKKECWQIVGFPEWWTERNGGRGSATRGRGGRGLGRGRGYATKAHATSSNSSNLPEFTQEQLQALSQMLKGQTTSGSSDKLSGKPKFGNVVLDTGASHHITGDLSLLSNVVSIPPCYVGFADGSKMFALTKGFFPLSNRFALTDVLYVPTLTCTLIFVSRIVEQTKCVATFTNTICVLQDRLTRTLIGSGEERHGVYYLMDVATARIHSINVSSDQRLVASAFRSS
ncbi:PREDICTED: uncharacterized protein LOC104743928 [Camelina sativa]|uniref:Uncharacterized protein LOC104743928 n=1 Tax=Camelina sativa TaxID=90675 RepID=A0ABM0VYU9_CAMSA|nr:PREDICTED: uncharacterized protein LOC104743928 [Camelina sativa]